MDNSNQQELMKKLKMMMGNNEIQEVGDPSHNYDEEYEEDEEYFENEDKMNYNVRNRINKILREQVEEVGNGNAMNSTMGPTTGIKWGGGACACGAGCNCNYKSQKCGGKFDIVKGITGLFPNKEFHMRDMNRQGKIQTASFCGPGTKLNKRLKNFNPNTGEYTKVLTPPINQLDEGCLKHDVAYSKYKDVDNRHKADRELVQHADKVIKNSKSTRTQKFNANLVKLIMKGKLLIGVGELFNEMDQMYYDEFMH